ncbi:hypothetical protein [Butyribacter intestini]|jgi:hypothetical protein|uniref:Uncharacterized protein n=1 Tax=Butyribacter intestini TaxID=1703332 RepID=A0AAW3JP61_9FIRM|nr:hypothetical protein [Butyribacter intestini]KQC83995.1 hypothetical protein APZ18_15440 [Butyribacter intestini]RHU71408.1 hypothetical protein DXC30_15660 [Butyribacter intestini]
MSVIGLKKVSFEEGKKLVQDYEYALIYYYSEKYFGKICSLAEINWEECLEAYFFNKTGQMHMYESESSEMEVTVFQEEQNNAYNYIDHKYEIANTFKAETGDIVVVREYLNVDIDNQTFVEYTRLLDVM